MIEIECPRCGKVTQLDTDMRDWREDHIEAVKNGQRPKFLCLQCWKSAGQPDQTPGTNESADDPLK